MTEDEGWAKLRRRLVRDELALIHTIAANIKAKRAERGVTLRKLGEVSGVAYGTIGDLENGYKNVTILTLAKIANALGCSVSEIVSPFQSPIDKPGEK